MSHVPVSNLLSHKPISVLQNEPKKPSRPMRYHGSSYRLSQKYHSNEQVINEMENENPKFHSLSSASIDNDASPHKENDESKAFSMSNKASNDACDNIENEEMQLRTNSTDEQGTIHSIYKKTIHADTSMNYMTASDLNESDATAVVSSSPTSIHENERRARNSSNEDIQSGQPIQFSTGPQFQTLSKNNYLVVNSPISSDRHAIYNTTFDDDLLGPCIMNRFGCQFNGTNSEQNRHLSSCPYYRIRETLENFECELESQKEARRIIEYDYEALKDEVRELRQQLELLKQTENIQHSAKLSNQKDKISTYSFTDKNVYLKDDDVDELEDAVLRNESHEVNEVTPKNQISSLGKDREDKFLERKTISVNNLHSKHVSKVENINNDSESDKMNQDISFLDEEPVQVNAPTSNNESLTLAEILRESPSNDQYNDEYIFQTEIEPLKDLEIDNINNKVESKTKSTFESKSKSIDENMIESVAEIENYKSTISDSNDTLNYVNLSPHLQSEESDSSSENSYPTEQSSNLQYEAIDIEDSDYMTEDLSYQSPVNVSTKDFIESPSSKDLIESTKRLLEESRSFNKSLYSKTRKNNSIEVNNSSSQQRSLIPCKSEEYMTTKNIKATLSPKIEEKLAICSRVKDSYSEMSDNLKSLNSSFNSKLDASNPEDDSAHVNSSSLLEQHSVCYDKPHCSSGVNNSQSDTTLQHKSEDVIQFDKDSNERPNTLSDSKSSRSNTTSPTINEVDKIDPKTASEVESTYDWIINCSQDQNMQQQMERKQSPISHTRYKPLKEISHSLKNSPATRAVSPQLNPESILKRSPLAKSLIHDLSNDRIHSLHWDITHKDSSPHSQYQSRRTPISSKKYDIQQAFISSSERDISRGMFFETSFSRSLLDDDLSSLVGLSRLEEEQLLQSVDHFAWDELKVFESIYGIYLSNENSTITHVNLKFNSKQSSHTRPSTSNHHISSVRSKKEGEVTNPLDSWKSNERPYSEEVSFVNVVADTFYSTGFHEFSVIIDQLGVDSGIRLGVCNPELPLDVILGEHLLSWCIDSEGRIGNDSKWMPYFSKPIQEDDIITIQVNIDRGIILFKHNEESYGIAFHNISGPIIPCVSLKPQCQVTLA